MLQAQVIANGTPDDKVGRIIASLSVAELREIAYPVLMDAYKSRERLAETTLAHTRTEKRLKLVDGKTVEIEVEVEPVISFTPMIVPRDAAGQIRRQEVRSAEQKALADARRASTKQQRLAAFVFLKSEVVSVGGKDVPWHELTKEQMEQRRLSLASQKRGLDETMELLDYASRVCREYGVNTLAEAEDEAARNNLAVPPGRPVKLTT